MKAQWNNKPNRVDEEQCIQYIRDHKVLGRVLEKFISKYESYGEVVGRITLSKVSIEDREILEGFFQKNYHGKKQIGITALDLSKALLHSRFSEVSAQRLLEIYAREELYSKAEVKQHELDKWNETFRKVRENYKETKAEGWIEAVQKENQYGYVFLQNAYRETSCNMDEVESLLKLGCEIVNHFPMRNNRQEYLAIFATRITRNPHAFDEKNPYGKYLLQILQWEMYCMVQGKCMETRMEFQSLEKQRLYLNAGILRDDISNYVVVSGIRAVTKCGRYHQGMEGFLSENNSVQVPLSVLSSWEKVVCPKDSLYIVENPSVYASLVDKWGGEKAIFCINGQPKLSSLVFLDLLEHEKVRIYYWGDIDPEGLLIAQKVKSYYAGVFEYWHMDLESYRVSKSNELISDKRIASLQKVTDVELQEVVEEMKKCKKAGYQERLLLNE